MISELVRRVNFRLAVWLGVALWAGVGPAPALAQVVPIASSPTSLSSTADRMISYRHQRHLWQTADGGMHLFINRGASPGGLCLVLYSSYDGGATWIEAAALPQTNTQSTSDGYLDGADLRVTYGSKPGQILFSTLHYDSATASWALLSTEVVYKSTTELAVNPSVAVDALGRHWLAFTAQDKTTLNYSIRMMLKASASAAWVDTGFVFGAVDNVSNERSGRPVATANGMGLVYTVHQNTYWAQRNNAWPTTAMWPRSLVYVNQVADTDPYGSHFSVTTDAHFNQHLASVDGGRVVYSRFLDATQAWTTRIMTNPMNATYLQAVMSQDTLVIVTNSNTNLRAYQSTDGGDTFKYTNVLTHPAATTTISYSKPRVEAPSNSSSPIPVLQQYVDTGMQRAMYFAVPVVGGAGGSAAPGH